jgi:hypothetical protein
MTNGKKKVLFNKSQGTITHVQSSLREMVYGRGSQIPGAKSNEGLNF